MVMHSGKQEPTHSKLFRGCDSRFDDHRQSYSADTKSPPKTIITAPLRANMSDENNNDENKEETDFSPVRDEEEEESEDDT